MTDKDNTLLVYGVWIEGQGWLQANGRYFADLRREYAEEALRFLEGTPARIAFYDDSMVAFERLFLAKEQERDMAKLRKEASKFNLFRYLSRIR